MLPALFVGAGTIPSRCSEQQGCYGDHSIIATNSLDTGPLSMRRRSSSSPLVKATNLTNAHTRIFCGDQLLVTLWTTLKHGYSWRRRYSQKLNPCFTIQTSSSHLKGDAICDLHWEVTLTCSRSFIPRWNLGGLWFCSSQNLPFLPYVRPMLPSRMG